MNARGHTLVELLAVLAILAVLLAAAAPFLRAYSVESHLLGAGYLFRQQFQRARSLAVRGRVQTAIRFEQPPDGPPTFSLYADGNHNGVLAVDIKNGVDRRISGPFPLDGGAPGVRIAILPGTPAIPPERGTLDTSDPIRFGRSNMVSFSPDGTATPGTFYLAGEEIQAAVRVNAMTARVRLLICRGSQWKEK